MALSVTPAIPASQIVDVIPSVLEAGGNALELIGLILTENARPPIGEVLSFVDNDDVHDFFGASTQESALADIYFLGFDNSTAKPGKVLFAQYNRSPVSAYLRGGRIAGLTLVQLQALLGGIDVTVDAVLYAATLGPTETFDLAAATSFSTAAAIVGGALDLIGAESAQATGSIAAGVLTTSAMTSGTIGAGDVVTGTGVVTGTVILAQLTGTPGGVGAYSVTPSQAAGSQALTFTDALVTYDSQSGAMVITSPTVGASSTITFASGVLAGGLKLTQGSGAGLSQGADATDPTTFMGAIIQKTQNWVSFMTTFEPLEADKELFAAWTTAQVNRYLYTMWDTSAVNKGSSGPTTAVGEIVTNGDSGTVMIYEDPDIDTEDGELAAFLMGAIASLDFLRTEGRATMAFRRQAGLAPQIFNGTEADNLQGYGLNFYGDYTTANEDFTWFYPGTISGDFRWIDSYVNQIWLNAQLQLALMVLLQNAFSIPYNKAGYALIEAACLDPINAAVNFGAIRPGITLSAAQIAEVNNSAGVRIDGTLSQRGWYLQIKDAAPQVRVARASPPMTLWYTDGQSVQKITLASIEVQ